MASAWGMPGIMAWRQHTASHRGKQGEHKPRYKEPGMDNLPGSLT